MADALGARMPVLKIVTVNALALGAVLLASACSDSADEPITVEDQWAALTACGMTGQFAVDSVAQTSCGSWPAQNEQIEVALVDGAIQLRFGALTLPVSAVNGCSLTASGCETTDNHYFAPTVMFSKTGDVLALSASANDIRGTVYGECHNSVDVRVSAVAACDPVGKYKVTDATLTSGTCDLTWGQGDDVEISKSGDAYEIKWGSAAFHHVTFDASGCKLHAEKGTANSEFWSFNGALRSATLDLTLNGGALQGSVTDQLMGTSMTGQTCAGATFALAAKHPQREAHALQPACASAPPDVCGDGVCAASENCDCADCACQNGATCTSAPSGRVCATACTLVTEAMDCSNGQKCGSLDEQRYPLSVPTNKPLDCIASGGKTIGMPCALNSECSAGLLCHLAVGAWAAECAPPCGVDLPACGAGRVCGPLGESAGGTSMVYERQYACEREVGLGGDCHYAGCDAGHYCQQTCFGAGETNCTYACIAP